MDDIENPRNRKRAGLSIEHLGAGDGIYDRVGVTFGGRRVVLDPCIVCQIGLVLVVLAFIGYVVLGALSGYAARA